MNKSVIILTLGLLLSSFLWAEKAIYIESGEIEGIPIGSFYLADKAISNQDFFNFIQGDGYNNKSLWPEQALDKFEQFKNSKGEYAPRSWEGVSPPVGQEFEPVTGITYYEAVAYANYFGWMVPKRRMWLLAQKQVEKLASYPWKDGKEQDSSTPVHLARYFAPAQLWESKFRNLQEEVSEAKQSSASISRVNANAFSINKLKREMKSLKGSLLERVASLEEKLAKGELEQLTQIKQQTTELASSLAQIEKQQQALQQNITDITQQLNQITELKQGQEGLQETVEQQGTSFDELKQQVEGLQEQQQELTKRQTQSKEQLASLEQQLSESLSQQQQHGKQLESVDGQLADLKKHDSQLQEDLAQTTSKLQEFTSNISKQLADQQQQLQELLQQKQALDQELTDVSQQLDKRLQSHDRTLVNLDSLVQKLENQQEELMKRQTEAKKNDIGQSTKLANLEIAVRNLREGLERQSIEDSKILKQMSVLEDFATQHGNKLQSLDMAIENLKHKGNETTQRISKLEEETNSLAKSLESQLQQVQTSLQQSWQQDLASTAKKLQAELTQAQDNFTSQLADHKQQVEQVEEQLSKLQQSSQQLQKEFREAATRMRKNMVDIGQTMLEAFKGSEVVVGPVSSEKEVPIAEKKESTPPPEPVVKEKVIEKIEKIAPIIQPEVDYMIVGSLCAQVSQIYFQRAQSKLAYDFLQLALDYHQQGVEHHQKQSEKAPEEQKLRQDKLKQHQQALAKLRRFQKQHWHEFKRPAGMVWMQPAEVTIGAKNNVEFPAAQVELPGFYIDQYEVTRGEFAQFVKQGYAQDRYWSQPGLKWRAHRQSPTLWEEPRAKERSLPITNINFYEAQAYANWAGKRLPTPQEWERAARYLDNRTYPWGEEAPRTGSYFRSNFYQVTAPKDSFIKEAAPVGAFPDDKTPEGVFDLAGNVAEWCDGWYKKPPKKIKVIKGGSFQDVWYQLQAHTAKGGKLNQRYPDVGFRCVKDVPAPPIDN